MKDLIDKISIETNLSSSEAELLLTLIKNNGGSMETAKAIYNKDGVYALLIYSRQVQLGMIY